MAENVGKDLEAEGGVENVGEDLEAEGGGENVGKDLEVEGRVENVGEDVEADLPEAGPSYSYKTRSETSKWRDQQKILAAAHNDPDAVLGTVTHNLEFRLENYCF